MFVPKTTMMSVGFIVGESNPKDDVPIEDLTVGVGVPVVERGVAVGVFVGPVGVAVGVRVTVGVAVGVIVVVTVEGGVSVLEVHITSLSPRHPLLAITSHVYVSP